MSPEIAPKPIKKTVKLSQRTTLPHQIREKLAGKPKTCGAKLRNKSIKCKSTIIMPNGRCRLHGGATPKGTDSPHFKTGKYSKYVHLPPFISDDKTRPNHVGDALKYIAENLVTKQKRCGAKLRNKNRNCRNTFIMRNGRCRLHGGKSYSGIAHPNYVDGRHSNEPLDKMLWNKANKQDRQTSTHEKSESQSDSKGNFGTQIDCDSFNATQHLFENVQYPNFDEQSENGTVNAPNTEDPEDFEEIFADLVRNF